MKKTITKIKKVSIAFCFFLSLMTFIQSAFSQGELKVFADWSSTDGSQNFFYKNVTKTDGSNNVYIVGATMNGNYNYDILTAKYNSSGVLQWIQQYNGGADGQDIGVGLYVDGSGNVYITGTVTTSSTDADIITIKYNSSGTQQWLSTYNGTGGTYDSGADIKVDSNGDVYITGSTYNTVPNTDAITIKYNSSGVQQWATPYNYTSNLNDVGGKISIGSTTVTTSGIVQTGTSTYKWCTMNFNKSTGAYTTGRISANTSTGIDQVNDMVEDASGNVYIVGATPVSGQGYNYDIIKLTSALALSWEITYNSSNLDDIAKGIKVDASGNVYVTGYTTSSTEGKNITTIKYNSSGTQQWIQTFNDSLDGDDEASAMAIDTSGNIYVSGYIFTEIDSADYYTMKYDASGNVIWTIHNDSKNHLNDKVTNITIDNNQDIIVTGESEISFGTYEYYTIKYIEKDIITPTDYNGETPVNSFSYYKNSGQLINTSDTLVPDIKYYAKNFSPEFYIRKNSYSFVFAHVDTVESTSDTLHRIDVSFSKCNANAKTYPLEEINSYVNYFLAHCSDGVTEIRGNKRLVTTDLYPNIDMMYSSNQNGIKYYFIVKQGGNPTDIMMEYAGASSFNLNGTTNELTINSSIGSITYERPTVYQLEADNTVDTITGWTADWQTDSTNNYYKFNIGSYNTSLPLIIQVDLGHTQLAQTNNDSYWSTFLGGSGSDAGMDIKTDKNNNPYIIGYTESTDFPVNIGSMVAPAYANAFVGKFDSLAVLKWLTYYGGSSQDYGTSLSIFENSSEKYLFACGYTSSSNNFPIFPASNPNDGTYYDSTLSGSRDGFIIKFDDAGFPIRAAYFGGCSDDGILSSDVDTTGALVITGYVYSTPSCTNFPLTNFVTNTYYQTSINSSSSTVYSFIAKFNHLFKQKWGTYFGGNISDKINSVTVNKLNGDIFVTGETASTGIVENQPCTTPANFGFPLCNCTNSYLDSTNVAQSDAFIAQFNATGNLLWSTFVGGAQQDKGTGVAVNSSGDIYITGYTYSKTGDTTCFVPQTAGFPLCNPYQAVPGNDTNWYVADIFITKFDSSHQLTWSTLYGGSTDESGSSIYTMKYNPNITIDNYDNLYITGNSQKIGLNNNFPVQTNTDIVVNQSQNAGTLASATIDAFIIWFNSQNQLLWASLYGGNDNSSYSAGNDKAMAIAVSSDRMLYITGITNSYYFPLAKPVTPNGEIPYYQYIIGGYDDAFITRIDLNNAQIGIKENKYYKESFIIYPNPAYNIINIKSVEEINKIKDIKLYNSFGQVFKIENLRKTDSNNLTINVSGLTSGFYLLSITTNKTQFVCKFVKY
ncbi:MAG: hypothetical protein A2X08_05850 [Bacteroidetes bacterium GWA2_32_17]|nr:MAG: hypothetical protein A2X08_05850 [Bacteroidetes bacterium GWA2_32_17]